MRYWLMKTEPGVVGIDDVLAMPNQTVDWWGVRNYQARNFMRDQMKVGDKVLFYHSNCKEPGIAGLAEVAKLAYPDRTQFDPEEPLLRSEVDARESALGECRCARDEEDAADRPGRNCAAIRNWSACACSQRGNRLSITPVDPAEWEFITKRLLK